MLLSLSQWLATAYPDDFSFLRVVQYITFRAVMAAMTALLIGLAFGPWVIRRLAALKIGQPIRGYGMDRWNFNVDACFNIFMTVGYDADGKWEIRLPKGKPGDYMVMKALMPQIVAISNCPILFNACNNYKLKPLTLEIMK